MKELSIKQKAEAYDKALERAENEYQTHKSFNGFREMLTNIFPELKESEDEKIRKEIIYHIQNCDDTIDEETEKRMVAWLEKQGEQKPTLPKWKYKKEHTPLLRDSIILNKYGCVAKSPSGAIVSDVWVLDYDELAKLPKEELEKQSEPKPTWDEEDEKRVNRIADFIWKNRKGDTDEIYQQEQDVNWLKSLKERIGG